MGDIKISGTLKSGTADKIIAVAGEIQDEALKKKQSEINQSIADNISNATTSYSSDTVNINITNINGSSKTISIHYATGEKAGVLSAEDKVKFDGYESTIAGLKDKVETIVSAGGGVGTGEIPVAQFLQLTERVGSIDTKLTNEIQRAKTSESNLEKNINQEIQDRTVDINMIKGVTATLNVGSTKDEEKYTITYKSISGAEKNLNIESATTTTAGVMSATDKLILDKSLGGLTPPPLTINGGYIESEMFNGGIIIEFTGKKSGSLWQIDGDSEKEITLSKTTRIITESGYLYRFKVLGNDVDNVIKNCYLTNINERINERYRNLANRSIDFDTTGLELFDGELRLVKHSVDGQQSGVDVIYPATKKTAGIMSAEDKTKLENAITNINNLSDSVASLNTTIINYNTRYNITNGVTKSEVINDILNKTTADRGTIVSYYGEDNKWHIIQYKLNYYNPTEAIKEENWIDYNIEDLNVRLKSIEDIDIGSDGKITVGTITDISTAINNEITRAKNIDDKLTNDVEYLRNSTVVLYGGKPTVSKGAVLSNGEYNYGTSYSSRVNRFNGGTTILLNEGYYFKDVLIRNADDSVAKFSTFSDRPKYYRANDVNYIYELNISKSNDGTFSTDELANVIAEVTLFGGSGSGEIADGAITERKLSTDVKNKLNTAYDKANLADTLFVNEGIIIKKGALVANSEPYEGTLYSMYSNKILANGETIILNDGYVFNNFKIFNGDNEFDFVPYRDNKLTLDNKGYIYQFDVVLENGGSVVDIDFKKVVKSFIRNHYAWDSNSNLNNFICAGRYAISGIREANANDSMPIYNGGKIEARLEVIENENILVQVLSLLNVGGGDGNIYTRTRQNGFWNAWGKLQTNIEVGRVEGNNPFDNFIDNGMYSGVYVYDSTAETFVLVVINAYLYGDSVAQLKYSTLLNGSTTVKLRTKVNGSWGEWQGLDGGSVNLSDYYTKEEINNKNYITRTDLDNAIGHPIVQQTETTVEIAPNVLNVWGEVTSLDITLADADATKVNEYMFQFSSGETATTLVLPADIKWMSAPIIQANKVYQLSIVNNLAVIGEFGNE